MKDHNNMMFEDWFDLYCERLRKLGHTGRIDVESAREDWENEIDYEEAAQNLYDEIG